MEKTIKLTMQDNKDITISRNEDVILTIKKENRTVKADELYQLLDYSKGDTYTIVSENKPNKDIPVIQFFKELLDEIANRINRIRDDSTVAEEAIEPEVRNVEVVDELPF